MAKKREESQKGGQKKRLTVKKARTKARAWVKKNLVPLLILLGLALVAFVFLVLPDIIGDNKTTDVARTGKEAVAGKEPGPGAGPQIISDFDEVPEDRYLLINCMPDPKKGLWGPQESKEDGWYYVKVQLLEAQLNPQESEKIVEEFAKAGKNTKSMKKYKQKIAEVQARYLPDQVRSYLLEAGPFTRAGYTEFIGRMWTILVRLRHGTVDIKDDENGRSILLTTSYPNALIKVQLFESKWDVDYLDKRQGEIAGEMDEIFNTIMKNAADEELEETRRWKNELRRN